MTEEVNQLIGKMLSSLENNTRLTEKISDKVDIIGNDVSKIKGDIEGHAKYLKNLDDRVVSQRKEHEDLNEKVTVLHTQHQSLAGILKGVIGVVGSIIASIFTYFVTR